MSVEQKISTAFEPYFRNVRPGEVREAIVVYRAPLPRAVPVHGRLRELKARLDLVRRRAAANRPVQKELFASIQKASSAADSELAAAPIGKNTLPVARVQVTSETLSALAEQPDVIAILPNVRIRPIQPKAVQYDALFKQEKSDRLTWGLKQLEIPKVWETTRGQGISVAVLDTGVYGEHPALKGRVREFIVVDPLGRRIKTSIPFDSDQHGTHVCGTIAGGKTADGVSIGVAPEADLLAAVVLAGNATLLTLMEGISWAVERGAEIVNMSLGFPYYEPLFDEVFKVLVQQYGILPVAAIGNDNFGNSSSPGNAPSALSVGAVEKVSGKKVDVAFFSSGASLVFSNDPANAVVTKPDVVAPGVQVYSSIPPEQRPDGTFDHNYMDGTSMATPHVSGVAALLMAAKPDASVPEIMKVLKETAHHPAGPDKRPDNRWGYGMIRPLEALAALS